MHFSVHILPAVAAAAGVNSPVIPRLVQKFILIHFSFGQRQIELFCDPPMKFSSVCSFLRFNGAGISGLICGAQNRSLNRIEFVIVYIDLVFI